MGKQLPGHRDAHEVGGVVERGQGNRLFNGFQHPAIYRSGFLEIFSTVDDPMANGRDFTRAGDNSRVGCRKLADGFVHGRPMVADGLFIDDALSAGSVRSILMGHLAHGFADPLHQA